MRQIFRNRIARIIVGVLVGLLLLIVVLPAALYIPFVQDFAKETAFSYVKKSTGIGITANRLRLKFPIKVELENVVALEASGDTLATLGSASARLRVLPLLKGKIAVGETDFRSIYYRLNNPDSALFLTVRASLLRAHDASMSLRSGDIDLRKALLDGATIRLALRDTTTAKADTSASKPLKITVGDIELRNLRYIMTMLPTIDSLGTVVGHAQLADGIIDTGAKRIHVKSLDVDSVSATYLLPSEVIAKERTAEVTVPTTSSSEPWLITADRLHLSAQSATYATRGVRPSAGFDPNYISAAGITIDIDSFLNHGSQIVVPIRQISATERCGLSMNLHGLFTMDSTAMHLRDAELTTPLSHITAEADMGLGNLTSDPSLPIRLIADASIAPTDVTTALPALNRWMKDIPRGAMINADANINGTPAHLDVNRLAVAIPHYADLAAVGSIANATDFNRMSGMVDLNGNLRNINFIKPTLLEAKLAQQINIPPTRLKGHVVYSPGAINGDLKAVTADGDLAFDGRWVRTSNGYQANLSADSFPVQSFLPSFGISNLTARVTASGSGFDFTSPKTTATADIDITHVIINGQPIDNAHLDATLADGKVNGTIATHNPAADLDANFTATLGTDSYTWDLSGDIRHIDLQALKFANTPMYGSLLVDSEGSYDPHTGSIDASVELSQFDWQLDDKRLTTPRLTATLLSNDSLTRASVVNGDLDIRAKAACSLDSLLAGISQTGIIINDQIASRHINIDTIQHTLPPISASISAGRDNLVADYLRASNMGFRTFKADFSNDSLLNLNARAIGFNTGSTKLDTITFVAAQHGSVLDYDACVRNRPGTMDGFAKVNLSGELSNDKITALLSQRNIAGEEGFHLGLAAQAVDSTLTIHFQPYNPIIGYKPWTVNDNNFVSFDFADSHLDANLKLASSSSSLNLYTVHDDNATDDHQEDVILSLNNIKIQDWLSISPFAPPMKGNLGADMRFRWDRSQLTGNGMIDLTDFFYGGQRVGTFSLQADVANSADKSLRANLALMIDSVKVITATGALNDSTLQSPMLLDFSMIHFPLRVVNPFLPKKTAQLQGMLNGQMNITGDIARPIFNGYIAFDSSAVKVDMMGGALFHFSDEKVPVDSNIVHFNDYTICGLNKNDLHINGTVDASHLTDVHYDLNLRARDMQIVNASRGHGADIYGKAFVDLDADVRGNMKFMNVDAALNILPGTNVTYVMADAQNAIASQKTGDMVRFVQFSDTTQVERADSITSSSIAMDIDASLIISEGTTIAVDLSPDGKNRASIEGNGQFSFSQNPMNDGRLTGRLNVNGGFIRFTPAVMGIGILGEKKFDFLEGSYVAFTGNMLNPILNIHAVDKLRANVTQQGQNSRLVNFDVGLSVTNTLENMDVAFDLSTNDDLTIENELSSMSAEQRANQAMNMLLYNIYTGPGTKANANLSGNPLYSFLSSQLNSWAANNIHGVDITFGVDQYDTTTDGEKSTTTSYSYRVSKSLFNDRFKIVIGGNYSTDADVDENFSQNLINDISFEYMLNRSGSMYVRLFRHVGYESVLEGEVTQTGVGFVLKRKLNHLRDIFRRFNTNKKAQLPVAPNQ